MANVDLQLPDEDLSLQVRHLTGRERLGEPFTFDLQMVSPEPVELDAVVGKPCALRIHGDFDDRVITGIVTRFTAHATSQAPEARRYSATVRSASAALELRRQSHVFQHKTVPAIVREVLKAIGVSGDAFRETLSGAHAEREYVVQYAETDAAFVRRLCEDEGLYFRSETTDAGETFVLEDTSSSAPEAPSALGVVDDAVKLDTPVAVRCRTTRKRRPGKVTLRDYAYEKPAVALEGVAEAGVAAEKQIEVYEAPGGFQVPANGKPRAGLRLETLRADATTTVFETNALSTAPGLLVTLEPDPGYHGASRPEGPHFVTGCDHLWSFGAAYTLEVHVIPKDVPFRLPRVTPRPVIHGVHPATVTGPAGQEIHTDAHGRVHLRFPWDRFGPSDDKSSLPVRTMQLHMPGSMAIPRTGWEVVTTFEDGDPDRPYVLGRAYNAKQPPPEPLPANKTVTRLGTYSSPGGGGQNSIQLDDAAGRQHLAIGASFGKSTSVANDMLHQTVKNETLVLGGSQTRTVGSNEDVSITQAYLVAAASQSATVGGVQKIYVKGNNSVSVGSESVLVGGALLEKVGDPVAGAKALAKAGALAGVGALGTLGTLAVATYNVGKGYSEGGWKGALEAGAGELAGYVPGADAGLAAITGAPAPAPWDEEPAPGGPQAGGGGTTGASDASAAAGPGPGHRGTWVSGSMMEMIGAAHMVISPGPIGWSTVGASSFLVAGSHTTKTLSADLKVLGASTENVGSLTIKTKGSMARKVRGAVTTQIGGALTAKSGAEYGLKSAASVAIKVAGSLKITSGTIVFECGGSKIEVTSGGVQIIAGDVKITGASKQSGRAIHQ